MLLLLLGLSQLVWLNLHSPCCQSNISVHGFVIDFHLQSSLHSNVRLVVVDLTNATIFILIGLLHYADRSFDRFSNGGPTRFGKPMQVSGTHRRSQHGFSIPPSIGGM